jgi:hypothetical protein
VCGNGAQGAFVAPQGTSSIAGGTYSYSSFTIPSGATVNVTGGQPLVVLTTGHVDVSGTLRANGGNAQATSGGVGVATGQNGGNGNYDSMSGSWKQGTPGAADSSWTACANQGFASIKGGTGGQGGTAYGNSGGGGGGGGAIALVSRNIRVSGTIEARGGMGAPVVNYFTCTGCWGGNGGSGGGGSVWLHGTGVAVTGSILVSGGAGAGLVGAGGTGVVRVDALEASVGTLNPVVCTPTAVAPTVEVAFGGSTWMAVNNGALPRSVVLSVMQ